jgi:DNA (cytosine-5)-methyltransferase 1
MGRKYELIVDNFAGGGGASTGIEMALGRSPDVAINHDPEALAMHEANHPKTRHYATDVFEIDPRVCVRNQPVGLAWFSPDCTHHSKARGGKPIREAGKKSRALAWVVVKWAERVRPRVIALENVSEFFEWGPVIPKVDDAGQHVADAAGRPMFVPCPNRKGVTFRRWQRKLERLGYVVEWKELRACDYGAPTIRKRFFCIARCDGKPIVWPKPTHGDPRSDAVKSGALLPWRCAADIIDWSRPCPSIFLTPEEARLIGCKRPLMPNTMKRIAAGVRRYVLEAKQPFLVVCNHGGDWFRGRGVDQPMPTATASRDANGLVMPFVSVAQHGGSNRAADDPLNTVTASTKDQNCLVAPFLASPAHSTTTGRGPNHWSVEEPLRTVLASNDKVVVSPHLQRQFGRSDVASAESPVPTVMPGGQGKTALVAAFLAQHNGGMVGHPAQRPLSTLTNRCTQQQVVAASLLSHQRTSNVNGGNGSLERPINCLTTANHVAEVRAFLLKYYGTDQDPQIEGPLHTITTKERFGLVTVEGVNYEIVDIGMRMLSARELFRAQGFPDAYQIDVEHAGRPLPKSSQVRMCGNSVCPQLAAALVKANCPELAKQKRTKQRELVGV